MPAKIPVKNDVDRRPECPGCGAEGIGSATRFCPDCGKLVNEGFQPLDAIRSSYRLQGRVLPTSSVNLEGELFRRQRSSIYDTAWACTVYSMVPYLGILFVPLAIGVGSAGYVITRGRSEAGAGRDALFCVGFGIVLLIIQLFLWWLLYIIPEIGI